MAESVGQFIDEALPTLLSLAREDNITTSILAFGLVFLGVSVYLAYKSAAQRPDEVSWLTKIAFPSSFCFGVFLLVLGVAHSSFLSHESSIRIMSTEQRIKRLEDNTRTQWFVRLIPYSPPTENNLSVGHIQRFGPDTQLYSFVADYEELQEHFVADAIRMVGGSVRRGQRVTVIIFEHTDFMIYPANARGLLQVIQSVQLSQSSIPVSDRFPMELTEEHLKNLRETGPLSAWTYSSYANHYNDFCRITHRFRCGTFREHHFIGTLHRDWHPLGVSIVTPMSGGGVVATNFCALPADQHCLIQNYEHEIRRLSPEFGARAFLIPNLEINSPRLANRYLIDVQDPERQRIPDIGFRPRRRTTELQ